MATRPSASGWVDNLSDDYDESDTTGLLNEQKNNYQAIQQQYIREHQEGLNKLGEAIKRQKYVASEIATEVDVQNEILDNINGDFSNVNENLRKNTRNIRLITKKSSTFFLWCLIVILALIIVGLSFI